MEHDKATASEIVNIPADLMTEQWQNEIRDRYKKDYIAFFKKQVAQEIVSEEDAKAFKLMGAAVEKIGGDTFEKLMKEGTLGIALEEMMND